MNDQKKALTWRFSGNELDELTRELRVGGLATEIEPKCFELLLVLLRRAGEAITIAEFQEAIWPGRIVAESAVTNLVSKLRKILNDDNQEVVKTIPKVGYRLAASVNCVASAAATPAIPSLKAGDPIPGRAQWRLSQALESGGYGDVWLVEHSQTGERRVFKFCVDSDRLSALKREVTLNRLLNGAFEGNDHYVRILEWNFEAPPYFIESLYAGLNLRQWFERKGGASAVPVPERLDVIATIAEALAAAHSVGVLHKDLKPENILIEDLEGRARVRVGDFGAGKLMDAEKLREFGITRLGFTKSTVLEDSSSGSLLYMAPELLSGGSPSVQSDIYSLGVLLYQIVADKLGGPMASGWESDIADELLRQDIADATHGSRERRLPSAHLLAQRLRSLDQRREELKRRRRDQDLAVTAQRALEKSRARRPWVMAATLLLVLGFGASSYFYYRELGETHRALEAARVAQQQADISRALNDFVTKDILEAANPNAGGSPNESIKEAVTRAIPRINDRFAGKPLVEASIDASLSHALGAIFDLRDALPLQRREVQILTDALGATDLQTLQARADLAYALVRMSRQDEATPMIKDLLSTWKARNDPLNPAYLDARKAELLLLSNGGKIPGDDPIALNRSLLSDAEAAHTDNDFVLWLKLHLVINLGNEQQWDEADRLGRKFLPDFMAFGARNTRTLSFRYQIAQIEAQTGHFAEAESELQSIQQGYSESMGPDAAGTMNVVNTLGAVYEYQQDWNSALAANREFYLYKAKHDELGNATYALSVYVWALDHVGRSREALPMAQSVVKDAKPDAATGESPSDTPWFYFVLIYTLAEQNRLADARSVLAELDEYVRGPGKNKNDASAFLALSGAYVAHLEGDIAKARVLATEAAALYQKSYGTLDIPSLREFNELLESLPKQ